MRIAADSSWVVYERNCGCQEFIIQLSGTELGLVLDQVCINIDKPKFSVSSSSRTEQNEFILTVKIPVIDLDLSLTKRDVFQENLSVSLSSKYAK